MPVATHIYHCYCVTAPFCNSEGTSEMSFHISVVVSLLLFECQLFRGQQQCSDKKLTSAFGVYGEILMTLRLQVLVLGLAQHGCDLGESDIEVIFLFSMRLQHYHELYVALEHFRARFTGCGHYMTFKCRVSCFRL